MTWPAEVATRADEVVARYPEPRSAVMPLLYLAMAADQGLTEQGMREVAARTGLTPVQVQSVASFYSMYKRGPVGKYVVSVCHSIACHLLGASSVLEAVADETGVPAGETGGDGVFTVEHVECIGACGGAPAAQVNYEMIEGLTPDNAREMCRWLRDEHPDLVNADEIQDRFGGRRSFDWGPADLEGATGPVPAFGPYGTTGGGE